MSEVRDELEECFIKEAEKYNQSKGILNDGEPDCPLCKNRRNYIIKTMPVDGYHGAPGGDWYYIDCECAKAVRALKSIEKSGLKDLLKQNTFDNFQTPSEYQKVIKNYALEFVENSQNSWFGVFGQSGSGKTHICTAICGELLKRGKTVKYFRWSVDGKRIKTYANDSEYGSMIDDILSADVLYIDDLFKRKNCGNTLGESTNADVKLAFELIDTATSLNKTLILSGEDSMNDLLEIDEAIAGRIKQKCGKFFLNIQKDKTKNFRLSGAGGDNRK